MYHDLFLVDCYTDNKSLVDSISSTKTVIEKRLKVNVCIIREIKKFKVFHGVVAVHS